MRSARLRHQVSIERNTKVIDARSGQKVEGWEQVALVWAAIEPLRGRELYASQQYNSEVTTKITLRALRGVTITHQMTVKLLADASKEQAERRFIILHDPIDVDLRGREWQLLCKEVH